MNDLISRRAAIDELEERIHANGYSNVALVSELNRSIGYIMRLPSAQPEQLTAIEQRIFLAAMGRELDICKEMDKEFPTKEAYEDTWESVCREITRKVKGALWT